jgi:DNA polymerase III sliding clamp (beta) subunit (PCNA family)
MKIPKGVLHATLARLLPVVEAKASIPILRTVHLHATEGILTLTTTDRVTWLRVPLPCTGELTAAVDARALAAAVRPTGKADKATVIDIEVGADGKTVTVATADSKVVVDTLSAADYPTAPSATDWQPEGTWPVEEVSSLGWVLRAVGHDESRPQLTGVYFDAEHALGQSGHAVSSDGYRLHALGFTGLRSGSVLLAGRAIAAVLRVLPKTGEVVISRAGEHVRLQAGDFDVTTKVMADRFPPWTQIIPAPAQADFSTVVDTERLVAALSRLPRGRGSESRLCRLRVNGLITLERDVEGAISTANVPVVSSSHTGDDFLTGIDAGYLADGLAGGDLATIRFGCELDPIRIETGAASDGSARLSVIMPARL